MSHNQAVVTPASLTSEKPYKCPFPSCGRTFRAKFSCTRHRLTHGADKKFVCPSCGKKFVLPQYLKEHINVHTMDCPYVCGIDGCQRRFKQSGKLSLHRRTHPGYLPREYKHIDEERGELEQKHRSVVADNKSAGRGLIVRQDSGQTAASGSEDFCPPHKMEPTSDESRLTRTALALHDAEMATLSYGGNYLMVYLDKLIMTPLSEGLRPVLPAPERMGQKKPRSEPAAVPIDLFKLTSNTL